MLRRTACKKINVYVFAAVFAWITISSAIASQKKVSVLTLTFASRVSQQKVFDPEIEKLSVRQDERLSNTQETQQVRARESSGVNASSLSSTQDRELTTTSDQENSKNTDVLFVDSAVSTSNDVGAVTASEARNTTASSRDQAKNVSEVTQSSGRIKESTGYDGRSRVDSATTGKSRSEVSSRTIISGASKILADEVVYSPYPGQFIEIEALRIISSNEISIARLEDLESAACSAGLVSAQNASSKEPFKSENAVIDRRRYAQKLARSCGIDWVAEFSVVIGVPVAIADSRRRVSISVSGVLRQAQSENNLILMSTSASVEGVGITTSEAESSGISAAMTIVGRAIRKYQEEASHNFIRLP